MNKWSKGVAYPLIGDKVRLFNDDDIWEVYWAYSNSYGTKYRLIPWPSRNHGQMVESWGHYLRPVPPEDIILDELVRALGDN